MRLRENYHTNEPGVKTLFHQGKEIIYIDFRGCETDEEMIAVVREAQAWVFREMRPFLQLTDLRGVFITKAYMDELRIVVQETPSLATKRAVLGMQTTVARKMLLGSYNFARRDVGEVTPFDTKEAALDWLVQ